ncbi:MAG: RnfABCDGE type electron transport complex subunit D [Kiritimatiellae bacterium]|nr:RnfABCDGE type electron transport complex subunit D [Kiritimatiellia bacterium]
MVSSSPHAHSGDSIRKIMVAVVIGLLPALVMAVYFFRLNALRLVATCVVTCVLSEWVARRLMKRNSGIGDWSAVVTGLLLAYNLPPGLPTWMAAVGSVVAIVIAKQLFGGLGYNPFNPALVGRVFLLVSFGLPMITWYEPVTRAGGLDAVTTATPLGEWKTAWTQGAAPDGFFGRYRLLDLLLGNQPGCIGEVSALALLIGGLFLVWRRCVRWHIPFIYLSTVFVFSGVLFLLDPVSNLSPFHHVLSGGLMLGAFFMATDMVTSPVTANGMLVFGAGCGVLTMLIRKWGGYPEGVSFAILIMNGFTPLINRATRPRPFGHKT